MQGNEALTGTMAVVEILWSVAVGIFVVMLVPLAVAIGRTTTEARHLVRDLARFGELRPALVRVRDEAAVFRTAVEALRRR